MRLESYSTITGGLYNGVVFFLCFVCLSMSTLLDEKKKKREPIRAGIIKLSAHISHGEKRLYPHKLIYTFMGNREGKTVLIIKRIGANVRFNC